MIQFHLPDKACGQLLLRLPGNLEQRLPREYDLAPHSGCGLDTPVAFLCKGAA
jgi:hypothetical protein